MKLLLIGFIFFCVLPISCFARDYQLNIPENTRLMRDVAPVDGDRELPYETIENKGIAVSCNLLSGYLGDIYGYFLRVIFRNNGAKDLVVTPKVELFDADGFVQVAKRDAILARSYNLTGNHQTTVIVQQNEGFASGFANGFVQSIGNKKRKQGEMIQNWINSYWLSANYELPVGAAVSGGLFYPIPDVGKLPLKLAVDVNGEKFIFVSNNEKEGDQINCIDSRGQNNRCQTELTRIKRTLQ
jgi:hypothetical protein